MERELKFQMNEQTVRDSFMMSKAEFTNFYKKLLPKFNDIDLAVIWSGIRENFEARSTYLVKSTKLDPVKLARYKQFVLGVETTEEEEEFANNGDPLEKGRNILHDNITCKWHSDKIKAMHSAGYTLDQIKKIYQGTNVTESYIKQYLPQENANTGVVKPK